MAKKEETLEEVAKINRLDVTFGQVDLNLVVEKVNELVEAHNCK